MNVSESNIEAQANDILKVSFGFGLGMFSIATAFPTSSETFPKLKKLKIDRNRAKLRNIRVDD